MQKIILILITIFIFISCANDVNIGSSYEIEPDYVLPQGNSTADDRIVELYKKYGSYFLYEFTLKDFKWKQNGTDSGDYLPIYGNPLYLGDMLDFLDDIWFDFYTDEFLKKTIPYRVFLCDSIRQLFTYERPPFYLDALVISKSMGIAGMNEDLKNKSGEEKRSMKNYFHRIYWPYIIDNGLIQIPEDFTKVSDYTVAASSDPTSTNYARERGFLPNITDYGNSEWCTYLINGALSQTTDFTTYAINISLRTEEEMAEYLSYDLVKRKYDIVIKYFKDTFGFDLQAIGNATY